MNTSSLHDPDLWQLKAPRYTSYPTAHHFNAQTNITDYKQWLAQIGPETTISAYVHIPFCKELCWFCACHTKMTKRYAPVAKYVRTLLQEIELIKKYTENKGKLINIHFGGGSPSLLEQNDWLSILYALASTFKCTQSTSLAIELDPRTTTPSNIIAYSKLGCNRVSIGIQDFNIEVQQIINRIQPFEMVASVIHQLRQTGIHEINLDLVYGLPNQTYPRFINTLEKILTLNPTRIALFSYAHIPHIKKHQRLIDTSLLPTIFEKLQLFSAALEILTTNGYVAIGIDHFAKPNDPLAKAMINHTLRRNFQGYTTDTTDILIGVGSSAISLFPQGYTQNNVSTLEYSTNIQRGNLATIRGWTNTSDDLARKYIIDELMCYMSVNLSAVYDKFNFSQHYFEKELYELQTLAQKNIVLCKSNQLIEVITPYRMMARLAAYVFDKYRNHTTDSYSQIV